MLNQNRTPPNWLGSSAVSSSDGSPPTIWCLLLWVGPWCVIKLGCGQRQGCQSKWHRNYAMGVGTDDGTGGSGGGMQQHVASRWLVGWVSDSEWMNWFVCQNSVQNLDFLRLHEDVTLCQCHFHFFCFLKCSQFWCPDDMVYGYVHKMNELFHGFFSVQVLTRLKACRPMKMKKSTNWPMILLITTFLMR